MRRNRKVNPGYLCPICIVSFPYTEQLSVHWKTFHVYRKSRNRSYPSVQFAARQDSEQGKPKKAGKIYVTGKKYPEFKIFHHFKTCSVNVHIPQICKFCKDIIWNCSKLCTDCGYVCHVECQQLVTQHCQKMTLYEDTKSTSKVSQMSLNGEMRPKETSTPLSSPLPSPIKLTDESSELDLTYITDRMIAMSFPANGLESVYRASLLGVLKMLQKKHVNNYRIVNVSERRYDIMQLNEPGHVLDYGWPDHLAPNLDKLQRIIEVIHSWLRCSTKNVAVIHCKGGISRIGVVVACYVQFNKNVPSPQCALDWFALRRYYDARLEGSIQPSQKRYVEYFGCLFEKKLKITNRIINLESIIIHGVPYYGSGGGFCIYLKIYQSYILKHTTKSYCVPNDCQRYCVSLEKEVPLQGDVMIKCLKKDASSQTTVFRLQFHTDAVNSCVAVFGKYDLDEAYKDPVFPDSSYIEFVFSPINELEQQKEQGIFDVERKMATHLVEGEKANTYHVPGPVNGNPYAQIDNDLKERLRSRPSVRNYNTQNLYEGIEDLDNLLGDLGFHTSSPQISTDTHMRLKSNNTPLQKHNITPSVGEIKYAPTVDERKASVRQYGQLYQPSSLIYREQISNSSSASDDVFKDTSTASNVNNLLYELDQSPLNSYNNVVIGKPRTLKTNLSAYDNDDSISSSETEYDRNDSVDGAMVIQAGTVAQHVQSLSKVLFKSENDYSKRMGVPLAGLSSPKLVEEKVSAFNSRSLAKGYCSPPIDSVYHSHSGPTRINYDMNDTHEASESTKFAYGSPPVSSHMPRNMDCTIGDHSNTFKPANVLMRSDSAYGESMSSSSSVVSPTSFNHSMHDSHMAPSDTSKQLHINASVHFTEGQDDNCSPRSENNQAKSSGIGSRSSSMTSLEYEDESAAYSKSQELKPVQNIKPTVYFEEQMHDNVEVTKATRSLNVVEEKIQSVSIQREVEFLNDDIFKNLLEDDEREIKVKPHVVPLQQHQNPNTPNGVVHDVKYINRNNIGFQDQKLDCNYNQLNDNNQKLNYYQNCNSVSNNKERSPAEEEEDVKTLAFKHLESLNRCGNYTTPTFNNKNIEYRHGIKVTNGIVPSPDENYNVNYNGSFPVLKPLMNGSINHNNFNTMKRNKSCPKRQPISNSSSISDDNPSYMSENPFEYPSPDVKFVETRRQLSGGGSSTNSDGQRSPTTPQSPRAGHLTLKTRRMRSSGGSNSSISSSDLFHEIARYPSAKFDKDTMSLWYKPSLSREEATQLLKDERPGAFVVRDSQSYDGAFGLAVKVETPPLGVLQQVGGDMSKIDLENELVRHFLIEPSKKGVRLKGSNNEPAFPSLVALIYQHTLTKMALPVALVIPEPDTTDNRKSNLTESQLLQKGAACNLVYLGTVDVESLTGDGAVHYAMNKITAQSNIQVKSTIINIKVNQQGITLTDNQRKIFFRRHYIMRDVLHCGVDPKGRKINLKPIVDSVDKEVGCFGFVVRKQNGSLENECHLCAELDADQPASAVINFIHKAMRYAIHQ